MQKYSVEARQLLALAIPVILAQVAQTAMGSVDTVMAGGYGATDVTTVAIGTSIWSPAILLRHGLPLALTLVVVQLNGSGRRNHIAQQMHQGFWLAGFVSVLTTVVLWNAGYIISSTHSIDLPLAEKAVGYLRALLWGAPGYLFSQTARNQYEGLAKTKPGMITGFTGLLVNIPVNYISIYGHFDMPELGGVGCSVATAPIYQMMFAGTLQQVRRGRSMRDIRYAERLSRPDVAILLRLVQLGLPIALALFFEITLFVVAALPISLLGIIDVADHQVALNFNSLMFALSLSLVVVITIRVGFRLKQGSTIDVQISARTGVGVGVCLTVFTATFIVLMCEQIVLLCNDNPEVVLLTSHLMPLAAVYQISDSIRAIGSGTLRDYKDTRSIFLIAFTAYWALGLPNGYLLALIDMIAPRIGPAGFWCGFIIGLTPVAIMMMSQMRLLQRQPSSIILQRATCWSLQNLPPRQAPSFSGIVTALYTPLFPDTRDSLMALPKTHITWSTAPQWGYSRDQFGGSKMEKALVLVIAAAMDLLSVVFTADAASATSAVAVSHTTVHRKKHHKAVVKPIAEQKAQAAKKHHKATVKPAAERKAQAAKKHHEAAAKPVVAQKMQATKKHHKAAAKPAIAQKAQATKEHRKAAYHATKLVVKPAAW